MVRVAPTLLGAIFCLTSIGCSHGPQPLRTVRDSGDELGTSYDILLVTSDLAAARRDLLSARKLCRTLERRFSGWREDSEIAHINRTAGRERVAIAADMHKLLSGALHVAKATGGAFDVTWPPLGDLWKAAAARGVEPTPGAIAAAQAHVGWEKVDLSPEGVRFADPGMRVGIDGVGKGWIIDALFLHLRSLGYDACVVNIGGDLRTCGRDASGAVRRFEISDPEDAKRVACVIDVEDRAVATSGNYQRFQRLGARRIGHIVDPRTGRPPAFDGSVTVLTRDAAMADALATAMFVMGPDAGLELARATAGVDVVFVDRDGIRATIPTHPSAMHCEAGDASPN